MQIRQQKKNFHWNIRAIAPYYAGPRFGKLRY